MCTKVKSAKCGIAKSVLSAMVVACMVGCCGGRPAPLPPWDDELGSIMAPYRVCKVYDSPEDFYAESPEELFSLAARLDAVCKKRKISRCAVSAAAHAKPFSYDDSSYVYAVRRCGFVVKCIEFEFDSRGCVQRVSTCNLVL